MGALHEYATEEARDHPATAPDAKGGSNHTNASMGAQWRALQEDLTLAPVATAGDATEEAGDHSAAAPDARGRLHRMKALYDLEVGKQDCRCLIRKWKFCAGIWSIAGGHKIIEQLLEARMMRKKLRPSLIL